MLLIWLRMKQGLYMLDGLARRISASKVDKKDRNSPYTISFQTTTKESSFDLLTSYVSFTESSPWKMRLVTWRRSLIVNVMN